MTCLDSRQQKRLKISVLQVFADQAGYSCWYFKHLWSRLQTKGGIRGCRWHRLWGRARFEIRIGSEAKVFSLLWVMPGLTATVMMGDFKGAHHPKPEILFAVFRCLGGVVSHRDLEVRIQALVLHIEHATLNRGVVKYSPELAGPAQREKRPTAKSWRMGETYIKVKDKWMSHRRAVDRNDETPIFMLSERRGLPAARRFLHHTIGTNSFPDRIVIDKSGANLVGLEAVHVIPKLTGAEQTINIQQVKCLNNILEQDYRFIKRITGWMADVKACQRESATLEGTEAAAVIHTGQSGSHRVHALPRFAQLAA